MCNKKMRIHSPVCIGSCFVVLGILSALFYLVSRRTMVTRRTAVGRVVWPARAASTRRGRSRIRPSTKNPDLYPARLKQSEKNTGIVPCTKTLMGIGRENVDLFSSIYQFYCLNTTVPSTCRFFCLTVGPELMEQKLFWGAGVVNSYLILYFGSGSTVREPVLLFFYLILLN